MRVVLAALPLLFVVACVPSETAATGTSGPRRSALTAATTSVTSSSTTTTTVDPSTLLESLFGDRLPEHVVVALPNSFGVWREGEIETVDHPMAGRALQVEGHVVAIAATDPAHGPLVDLHAPEITYPIECPRLMIRGDEILALNQCWSDEWFLVEVTSGQPREAPIDFESRQDGEYVWFAERGGTVVTGIGDAEGNLTQLTTLEGVDLLGDAYAGLAVLSTDGKFLAFVDHADPAALSHFWSPVVVMVDIANGVEMGRWALDNPVLCLELAETWIVACEVEDPFDLDPKQVALVAIDLTTGEMNRVETTTRVFLPG